MRKLYALCLCLLVRPNIELDSVLKKGRDRQIFVHVRNTHTLTGIEHNKLKIHVIVRVLTLFGCIGMFNVCSVYI